MNFHNILYIDRLQLSTGMILLSFWYLNIEYDFLDKDWLRIKQFHLSLFCIKFLTQKSGEVID